MKNPVLNPADAAVHSGGGDQFPHAMTESSAVPGAGWIDSNLMPVPRGKAARPVPGPC